MEALNARDQSALVATLHFPHHRLTARGLQTWTTPDGYLSDFLARAGDGWARSAWNFVSVVAASPDKVHLDVEFTRYRADGSEIARYRSLWVITRDNDRWAAALRSSFAG
jgi:hypothetical protein